jgi:hypothetical protein
LTQPFTYLIGWSTLNVWYYGVRYSNGCSPKDLWTVYFSSSKRVKNFIEIHGDPDIVEIRKTFDTQEKARLHEHTVLRRIKAKHDPKFLNSHDMVGFPILQGDANPSKRPEVRKKLRQIRKDNPLSEESIQKMSRTKTTKNLIKLLKQRHSVIPKRSKRKIIQGYINFLSQLSKSYKSIVKWLVAFLQKCHEVQLKPYPKNRKSGPRGQMQSISLAKTGTRWYYNPLTLQTKPFKLSDEIPEGWVEGMIKSTPNNNTAESNLKKSMTMTQLRKNESTETKNQRIEKYHESIRARRGSEEY